MAATTLAGNRQSEVNQIESEETPHPSGDGWRERRRRTPSPQGEG
ncbi:MAG: hypothetical protein ABSH52_16500 [Terriglobia bacterium]